MTVSVGVRMLRVAAQLYEPLNRGLGVRNDQPPDGVIHHFAARTKDGFHVFAWWKPQEAFGRVASDRLPAAVKKLTGARRQPTRGEPRDQCHR